MLIQHDKLSKWMRRKWPPGFFIPGCNWCTTTTTTTTSCTVPSCHCMNGSTIDYQATISGITSGDCTCNGLNGTFCMHYTSPCLWVTGTISNDSTCGSPGRWTLKVFGQQVMFELDNLSSMTRLFLLPCEGYDDCSRTIVANVASFSGTRCTNWPASITVVPVLGGC